MIEEILQAQKTSGPEKLSPKNCALSSIPSRSPQNGDEGNLDRSWREKIHFQFSLCSEIFIFRADSFSIFPLFPNCEERPLSMFNSAQNRPDRPN